jgi:signal transduction histidine kinase
MGSFGDSVRDIALLFIDDDASLREVMGQYLEEQGFQTTVERSGELALLALSRQPFDIVITDLRMPGMSGLDVVRGSKEKQPGAEVIVITGYATITDGVEAMRAGAFDFVLKPLKLEVLDAVLGRCVEWIRHKRSRAELEEVNRRLLELSRMKGKFLAVTDHELRTPVTVIDGMLQYLLRGRTKLPEELRPQMEELGKVSQRLVELVQGIHELAECRTHGFPLCRDWVGAGDLLGGISVDFLIARFNRDLNLKLIHDDVEDVRFKADQRRVKQVITELIQNAVKATPDGGTVEVCLAVRADAGGPRFCVEVSDTGIGIAPEEQEKIFEAFYEVGDERHHHSSKYEFRGAGLGIGLSIAREVALAHGGGVEVVSQPGEGSKFTFWLPLA